MEAAELDKITISEAARWLGLPEPEQYRPGKSGLRVPYREDNHPSMSVWTDGCGYCDWSRQGDKYWSGNAVCFISQCTGKTYSESVRLIECKLGKVGIENIKLRPWEPAERRPSRDARPDPLSQEQLRIIRLTASGAVTLHGEALAKKLCQQRKWKRETVRRLSLDNILGVLHFSDEVMKPPRKNNNNFWPDHVLSFIYGWGVKCRWRQNGKRMIRWLYNYGLTKPTLWNGPADGGKIIPIPSDLIWLTEGETDAIRLMDLGAPGHVMALPSAGYKMADWELSAIANKNVVLALDNDPAGQLAKQRAMEQLLSVKCKVRSFPIPDGMDVDNLYLNGQLDTQQLEHYA